MSYHTRRIFIGAAVVLVLLLVCIGGLVPLVGAARPLRTHSDTVAYALERRGVRYDRIGFDQSYEESIEFDVFRAQVRVHLPDGRVASGWIGCENGDRTCFLELRSLGITGEQLPDIGGDGQPPWQVWLDRLVASGRAWLRLEKGNSP